MYRIYLFLFLCVISGLASNKYIIPLPQSIPYDTNKAQLGEKLFFDTILSKDGTISCFSCHNILVNGADGKDFATGINNQTGIVNTPTVFNAVFNFRQNWDGSAKNLAQQAKGPITNPIEMGHNFGELVEILDKTSYREEFIKNYDDGITVENIVDAIQEFQKKLITPNAPFDKYLNGDDSAITQDQKDGYDLFISKGCIACHNGINIGGQLFSRFGMVSLINDNTNYGLYNITKEEEDRYYFKVPSLRNVALTPPYFHDASAKTLYDAVSIMLKYQVGRTTDEQEINKIIEFLKSLNGEVYNAR